MSLRIQFWRALSTASRRGAENSGGAGVFDELILTRVGILDIGLSLRKYKATPSVNRDQRG
jgi:hypothetical protein